jgi:hypothetical protein
MVGRLEGWKVGRLEGRNLIFTFIPPSRVVSLRAVFPGVEITCTGGKKSIHVVVGVEFELEWGKAKCD